jgi:hypothetical protein
MKYLLLILFLFGCIPDECDYECWDGSSVCDANDCPDECEGYQCWDDSCVDSEADCPDQPNSSLDILFSSDTPIAGFQFDILSATLNGAGGGAAANAGFTVSSGNMTVIGFSLTGSTIPPGEGVLVTLDIIGDSNNACLSNPVISDSSGNDISVFIMNCNTLVVGSTVEDFFSHNESDLIAFYFFDQVLINNQQIDATDWVAAFNGDICVGAKKWNCDSPTCDLPIYGYNNLNSLTNGYMLFGDLPSFKIYDTSDGILYSAMPSSNILWQDGDFNQIATLTAE